MNKKLLAAGVLTVGLVTLTSSGVAFADSINKVRSGERRHNGGHRVEFVANLLGMSADELQTQIDAGADPRELLEAAGITRDDMRAAKEQHKLDRLTQAVTDGRITQEEADERIAKMEERKERRDAAHTALENNDYDAWAAAMAGTPIADKIDNANFSQLVEAHNLREAGDKEGARAIMEELGIEKHKKGKRGGHHRFGSEER